MSFAFREIEVIRRYEARKGVRLMPTEAETKAALTPPKLTKLEKLQRELAAIDQAVAAAQTEEAKAIDDDRIRAVALIRGRVKKPKVSGDALKRAVTAARRRQEDLKAARVEVVAELRIAEDETAAQERQRKAEEFKQLAAGIRERGGDLGRAIDVLVDQAERLIRRARQIADEGRHDLRVENLMPISRHRAKDSDRRSTQGC